MSNKNQTFTLEYRGHEIAVLALDYPTGWIFEVNIEKGGQPLMHWRVSDCSCDGPYTAREAGMKLAKERINALLAEEQS